MILSECAELIVVPIEKAMDMVMKNEIRCIISAHGILRATNDGSLKWIAGPNTSAGSKELMKN